MKAFLKENIVLVVGIALPLLLTFIFFAATQLDHARHDPPRYSVIFSDNQHYNNALYTFFIKDDALHYSYTPPKNDNSHHYRNPTEPRLFIYDPLKHSTREIELPPVTDLHKRFDRIVKEIHARDLSSLKTSPDGFVFERSYRHNGNVMTELFGGGYRSRNAHVLRKDSYSVKIPQTSTSSYNIHFIGWIIEEDGGDNE